ncbi:hypothetical protein [Leptospirillum ferrooxidans]|uniref:hypothetical protein n=1 Tax=Leptospirillum ferrooxidans TaxID=180 RepID=UPI001305086D|nr:hypothetical protein [Leptospirillum ferrooxidans]
MSGTHTFEPSTSALEFTHTDSVRTQFHGEIRKVDQNRHHGGDVVKLLDSPP